MALNKFLISITVFFFILSTFTSEAQDVNPPQGAKRTRVKAESRSSSNAPASSKCAKKYIEENMKITANKTREFLKLEIRKRLNDRSTGDAERKCLVSCFQAYQNAGQSIARGSVHVSNSQYVKAVHDVVEYSKEIAPCLKCSRESVSKNAELLEFQKWAKKSGDVLRNKLKSCN